MSEKAFYISELLQKKLKGDLTVAEEAELNEWLDKSKENKKVLDDLNNEDWVKSELEKFERYDEVNNKEKIERALKKGKVLRFEIKRLVAAASIILVLGVGGYLLFFNKSKVEGPRVTVAKTNDVPAPNSTKAMITLADGTKVFLDSVGNGTLARQDNVKLVKLANGQIAYQNASGEISTELKYNTLNNPRGSKVIDMQLSDGSHVWLNAGSSVTYPVAFIGNERKVEITGEAYFEVKHDASKPFVVSKGEISVTVLGTHFNVNAYDDEDALKVTLLEGSVKVAGSRSQVTIKPGEQAVIANGIKVDKSVDVDQVMAWKNGKFDFGDKSDFPFIMRQIARWYDVDVEFKGNVPQYFGGSISRDANISEVLKVIETSSGVQFKIEGKKITVIP